MNGFFVPQISPNVGHYQPAADFQVQNGLNAQQMDNNSIYNQYYPTNINFGVQNVYCNNFLQHPTTPTAAAPQQPHQQTFYQHYPTTLLDQTALGDKMLDARPESLWETKNDGLKLPSLHHAHAAELRNGFARQQPQANKERLHYPTYSNDEAEAVSALASLGHGSSNDPYRRYCDAATIKLEDQQQSQSHCQNSPQVHKINQSNVNEINNSQKYGKNKKQRRNVVVEHQTNPEWYMNGVKFEALKTKSGCSQTANLPQGGGVVVADSRRQQTQFNDNHLYNGYDTAQLYTKNFVTPEYNQQQQHPDFAYAFGPARVNQINNFVNSSIPMQHLPLKLEMTAGPSTAGGPLSQESPAYKSFCENSLNVDGLSSWRPAFVQKSPALKISPRNRSALSNGIAHVSPSFPAAFVYQQSAEIQRQIQQQRVNETNFAKANPLNGFAINNTMVQNTPQHFSPNDVTIQFRHVEDGFADKNPPHIGQASSSELIDPKKIPTCQLGDILAMKKKISKLVAGGDETLKNFNNYSLLPNETLIPKMEPFTDDLVSKNSHGGTSNETDISFSLAGAKDFVNEFIRQMDDKVEIKSKQKESVVKIEGLEVEVDTKPKKKPKQKVAAIKPDKLPKSLAKGTKSVSVVTVKTKKEIPNGAATIPKTFVSMHKIIEKDPLSLSLANLYTLLAINAKSASLKNKEKCFISNLPSMYGSPIKVGVKSDNSSKILSNSHSSSSILSSSTFDNSSSNATKIFHNIPESERVPLWNGTHESEESLIERLNENLNQPVCVCNCLEGKEFNEEVEGPYYTHLAASPTVSSMRKIMEERFGQTGNAIRIEQVRYTGKEGKTPEGCPIAKWIIRRSGIEEKVLCLVRHRRGHFCATAVLCVIIVVWEGVPRDQADDLYDCLRTTLPLSGIPTNRRCETNEKRNCACQGIDAMTAGASFSFGCSWSMYYNACKFAKSATPQKFKLANVRSDNVLENRFHLLADSVGPMYKRMAPASYRNQTFYSNKAHECRLGRVPGNPFSGITACVDFCAHAHKDAHNMNNGCTVVVTLTKHRGLDKPDDEQLHVLPMYVMDETKEHDNVEGQLNLTHRGLDVLTKYPLNLRLRTQKLPSCKQRTKMKTGQPSSQKKLKLGEAVLSSVASDRNTHSSFSLPDCSQPTSSNLNTNANFDSSMVRSCESTAPKYVPPNDNRFNGAFSYMPVTNQTPFGGDGQHQIYYDFANPTYQSYNANQNGFNAFDPNSSAATPTSNVIGFGHYPSNYASPWNASSSSSLNGQFAGTGVVSQNVDPWNNGSTSQWPSVAQEIVVGENILPETPNASMFTPFHHNDRSSIDLKVGAKSSKRKLSFDSGPEKVSNNYFYKYTENESAFNDNTVGGVAIALGHGSVLFEVAKKELHATTALNVPDRRDPKRISLVFYQHKQMNYEDHGAEVYRKRVAEKAKAKENFNNAVVVDESIDDLLNESSSSSLNYSFSLDLPDVEQLPTWDDFAIPSKRWSTTPKSASITVGAKSTCQCRVSGQYSLKG